MKHVILQNWMANLCPAMLFPCSLSRASVSNNNPLPVAASLPKDPAQNINLNNHINQTDLNLVRTGTYNGFAGHNSRRVSMEF